MGLFDLFKGKKEEMTPLKATTISLLYLMNVDGDVSNEELGSLLSILGGKSSRGTVTIGGQSQSFMDECIKYTKSKSYKVFLEEVSSKLTDSQKMFIITNMIDMSFSDSNPDESEQTMIQDFIDKFEIDIARLAPVYQVLEFKNDRKIFTDDNYEKNEASYSFRVKLM